MPPRHSPTLPSAAPAAGRNLSAMRAAGVLGGGNDVAAERLGLAERKFANDVNHQAAVERAKAEDQRIARENLAIRQFMEPIRAQEAAANFARKMLDMKNELNGRHQLVNFNLALDELDPRDHDYETQVAQLRLSPQFSDIPHVKGADLAIEKYVAMTAKSRDVYAPLRKAGIDLEKFTIRGPRGEFMEFKLREAQKAVLTQALADAKTIGGGRVGVGSQGVTIYPPTPEKPVDPAKEASEKAKAAASNKRFVTERRIRQNDNELHSLQKKVYALELLKVDADDAAEIKAHSDRIKELTADNDRLLREMETPDSPPPPAEQKKTPVVPPATTGTPPNPSPAPAPETSSQQPPVDPAAVKTTAPAAKKERIPFKDRMKEPVSQPQASAAPDMNALTASARDFSSFSGRREEIESNPDLSAKFNAAAESMSQMLQSLGYDADASAASGGYVADGSTIEFEQDEDGEPVAVTVDPDGARTPLKKAASEATASIDSPITAS